MLIRPLVCALSMAMCGCASVGVVSRPYLSGASWDRTHPDQRAAAAAGYVTYKLPVTVVDLNALYEVRVCPSGAVTSVARADQAVALVSLGIESFIRSDPNPANWFDVDASDWSGFAVALAEAKLEMSSDQILTSVNYRSQPQFTQTVAALTRLATITGAAGTLSGGVQLVACTQHTVNALAERERLRALVARLDPQIDTIDAQPVTDTGSAQRARLVTLRDAALKRILDIRDGDLRYTVRYRWTPGSNEFQRSFPEASDALAEVTSSQFDLSATDAEQRLRALMGFSLQLRPEPQRGGVASQDLPLPDSECAVFSVGGNTGTGVFLTANTAPEERFTGLYYRAPVRVHPIVARTGGSCREIGWITSATATTPLNLTVFQYGAVQRVAIEGSSFFARSRGATWTNGVLTTLSAGANDATGPGALGAIGDVADAPHAAALAAAQRETTDLTTMTALQKARQAYEESVH